MEEFMDALAGILAIVCIFGLPVILGAVVLLRLITSNNKERLELARHGIIPPEKGKKPSPNRYRTLRNGMLCMGIALGLLLGIILVTNISFENYVEFLVITASTVFFMGLAYVVFYLLVRGKEESEYNPE